MDLRDFDDKCVRLTDASGAVYEGTAAYFDREYVFHEYGCDREALCLTPILFYKDDISSVISLESANGPFGHYSERYGLLERKCLDGGTDLIGEVLDSEDDERILRMLLCMNDNFQSLAARAVPGMAPWRSGTSAKSEGGEEDEHIYIGELESMLDTLVKYDKDDRVVGETKRLLESLSLLQPTMS